MIKPLRVAAFVGFASWLAAAAAFADRRPVIPIEGSIESVADQISLPSYDKGLVTVRACSSCPARTLYFSEQPSLYVSGTPVTVSQLKTALADAGTTSVTVHYRLTDSAITRIVLVK